MTTGERIRILRMEKGLSQEGLADALDVTRQAVSRWETDASLPDIDKLIVLCDLFGVSLDYLVRGKEPDAGADRTDPAETTARTRSIPISRTTIAGVICIALGISAAPLLIFAFTPFFSAVTFFLAWIPAVLLLAGILLLWKRKPAGIWWCWGLLLTGALVYTCTSHTLYDTIRGSLARYPSLLFSNWEEYRPQMWIWAMFGILLLGMMLWTILQHRKTGLKQHRMRWFLLSVGLFLGSTVLLTLLARQIVLHPTGIVISPLQLYLLFWLAMLSLTYCLVWLLSPKKEPAAAETE